MIDDYFQLDVSSASFLLAPSPPAGLLVSRGGVLKDAMEIFIEGILFVI